MNARSWQLESGFLRSMPTGDRDVMVVRRGTSHLKSSYFTGYPEKSVSYELRGNEEAEVNEIPAQPGVVD